MSGNAWKHEQLSLLMASSKAGPIIHCHGDSAETALNFNTDQHHPDIDSELKLETHSAERDWWHPFGFKLSHETCETKDKMYLALVGLVKGVPGWKTGLDLVTMHLVTVSEVPFSHQRSSHNIILCWIAMF